LNLQCALASFKEEKWGFAGEKPNNVDINSELEIRKIENREKTNAKPMEKFLDSLSKGTRKSPWASGGRTKVVNGRALCADCHEIISHKDRLKRVDKKRKPKEFNPLF